ncbi:MULTISPECIES: isochorismate synthase [Stenotrophomonas]|uniref:isochorismate synthase n=1 Tax=Stenotrophomonas TaxID=40323 RepID=UPI0022EB1303|nr:MULTISPECIES: isochorismate synthase [Stenotrophomonas]MDA3305028.1 isochorismate synthase [Stenotrophomonas sp. PI_27]WGS58759.1 isochorismate synthase [Stenotrophomonas pavanii]
MNDSLIQGTWPEAAPAPQEGTDDASLFLLQHAGQHVHARGCRATLPAGALETLAERVSAFFAQQRGGPGLLVGAVPFEPRADDALYQPERLLPALPLPPQAAPALEGALQAEPAPEAYAASVAAAVQVLRAPGLDLQKVVLARSLLARTRQSLSPEVLLARLGADPSVATYAVPLPVAPGQAPAWLVGATPELLLRKRGAELLSHPLAGSARRGTDAAEDERAAQALLASTKDHDEHRHVVEAIVDGLAPYCSHIDAQPRPALHATASMWHLGTRIHATLKDPQASAAALLAQLHPTPAVCGTPRLAALQRIGELEPVPRGFYAGAVGWLDAQGDGDWYVAIRCARLQGTQLRLFAGAGIVAESQPEAEVAETAAKFAALLNALGVHASAPTNEPAA